MAKNVSAHSSADAESISPNDILFECPSCGKSLVVDESAEGLIIDCPKCQTNVIVPPRPDSATGLSAPPPSSRPPAKPEPVSPPPPPAPVGTDVIPELHQELTALATRIKEVQTQWADATNRIATRINDINRELVGLARLEAAHKQALKEWQQLVARLAEVNDEVMQPAPQPPPSPS